MVFEDTRLTYAELDRRVNRAAHALISLGLRPGERLAIGSRSETRFRAVSWVFAADRGSGWDHLGVLLSLVYRLLRCLVGLLAVLARSDLSKDAELLVLRHENQVLRRQLRGRLRWDHADRVWLAALSRLVNRRRWPQVFPAGCWQVDYSIGCVTCAVCRHGRRRGGWLAGCCSRSFTC